MHLMAGSKSGRVCNQQKNTFQNNLTARVVRMIRERRSPAVQG
jgi:hypothetical protein